MIADTKYTLVYILDELKYIWKPKRLLNTFSLNDTFVIYFCINTTQGNRNGPRPLTVLTPLVRKTPTFNDNTFKNNNII